MSIRDTSAQDVRVSTPPPANRRRLFAIAAIAAVALLLAFGVAARFSGSRSVAVEKLRIAEVTRGTLVRDASVNGRVVAAVSPTLYTPIASLAHSGAELLRRGQHERLPTALATIEERARHLEGFVRDYARFAKLPAPRLQPVAWAQFLAQLRSQVEFRCELAPDDGIVRVDAAQFEQALLNLVKNAHESGSAANDVAVHVRRVAAGWRIDVLDRGPGMSEAVLAQALLPFYSTKRHGTGLGLALAREIAEAHGGRIALLNRDDGGLCVSITLPD